MAQREKWIDRVKGAAMVAVVFDHYIYRIMALYAYSFFSVTVFVLMAGYNAYAAADRRQIQRYDWKYAGQNLCKTTKPYLVGTLLASLLATGSIDTTAVWENLRWFNAQPQYYFIAFYMQLILVGQIFYMLLVRCRKASKPMPLYVGMTALVAALSLFSFRFTRIPGIYGGGGHILGASFLLAYFLGALAKHMDWPKKSPKLLLPGALVLAVLAGYYVGQRQELFGTGDLLLNPPGVTLFLYSVGICGVLVAGYFWLEKRKNRVIQWLFWPLEIFGRYSLQIYMYHMIVFQYLHEYVLEPLFAQSAIAGNIMFSSLLRLGGFLIIMVVPVCVTVLYQKGKDMWMTWWHQTPHKVA